MTEAQWYYIIGRALCGFCDCHDCRNLLNVESCPADKDLLPFEETKDLLMRIHERMKQEFYPDDVNPFPCELTDEDFISVLWGVVNG